MKIVDKYLLRQYLLNFIVVTFLFLGLAIIVDFFTKLKAFLQIQQVNSFHFISQYYFCRIPIILVELTPLSLLGATMLVLTRLTRTHEIIPLLTSGINFYRLLKPITLVTILISVGIFLVNEYLVPSLGKDLSRTEKILKSEGIERYILIHDQYNSSLVLEKYDYTNKTIYHFTMIKFDPSGRFAAIISAERAQWHPELTPACWYLYQGEIYPYDQRGLRQKPIRFGLEGYPLEATFTPEDLEKSEKSYSYLNIKQLNQQIQQYPQQPYLIMQLYNKISLPLTCLLLFILGIPFLLICESPNFFVNIGVCLVVSLCFFVIRFLLFNLGSRGAIAPGLAFLISVAVVIILSSVFIFSGKIRT